MKTFKLEGQPRKEIGKKAVKALRKEGLIPAVLYGEKPVDLPYSGKLEAGQMLIEKQDKGAIVTNFAVTFEAVRKLIYTPEIFVVELNLGGRIQKAILKDLQLHPVTDEILHIDFLAVFDDKPVVMEVPVVLDGFAAGVKAGGKLILVSRKLKVKAWVNDIPERLHINVEKLRLGKNIQVKNLKFPNLMLMNAPDNVVCAVVMTRGAVAGAEEEETEEAAEATETPSAE